MDLICSNDVVYTSQKDQTPYQWWWPPHSTWIKVSYHIGYWTAQCEEWYQDRLQKIKDGTAQPLTRSQWKTSLHRGHLTRPFFEATEAASFNYFQGRYWFLFLNRTELLVVGS